VKGYNERRAQFHPDLALVSGRRTPAPLSYFVFLIAATGTYLLLVELVKRRLMRRM
jgi:hypothetical protein